MRRFVRIMNWNFFSERTKVLLMTDEKSSPESNAVTDHMQEDDDLDEPLPAPQCRIDDPECESCQ